MLCIFHRFGQAYTMSTVSFGVPIRQRGMGVSGSEKEMRAPTFTTRPESMISVFRDEEIRLSCIIQGEPTPRGKIVLLVCSIGI